MGQHHAFRNNVYEIKQYLNGSGARKVIDGVYVMKRIM